MRMVETKELRPQLDERGIAYEKHDTDKQRTTIWDVGTHRLVYTEWQSGICQLKVGYVDAGTALSVSDRFAREANV